MQRKEMCFYVCFEVFSRDYLRMLKWKNRVLPNLVQECAWLLLIFFIYLRNQLSSTYSIITY